MTNTVFCAKLKKEAPSLPAPPYPGKIGQRIFENISEEAWNQWLTHQTMLINEYRLSLVDAKARTFLSEEMEKFLFCEGSNAPEGYNPE